MTTLTPVSVQISRLFHSISTPPETDSSVQLFITQHCKICLLALLFFPYGMRLLHLHNQDLPTPKLDARSLV